METRGRLFLVRHGQTPANLKKIWHGTTDTPLTELGHEQARRLGSYFANIAEPHVIYSSPLQRARHTAMAVATPHRLEVVIDTRLQEFGLGEWEGFAFEDISTSHDREGRLYTDPGFAPPGGESQTQVRDRMVAAIEEILTRHPGQNVVMVSHGVAISIALSHYLHRDTRRWLEYSHHNTAYSELCTVERSLLIYNCTDHLTQ